MVRKLGMAWEEEKKQFYENLGGGILGLRLTGQGTGSSPSLVGPRIYVKPKPSIQSIRTLVFLTLLSVTQNVQLSSGVRHYISPVSSLGVGEKSW